MVHPVVSNFGHPSAPDIRRSSSGPDASWVDISVRGDVVDLAARDADIVELPVTQVEQLGSYPWRSCHSRRAAQQLPNRLKPSRTGANVCLDPDTL